MRKISWGFVLRFAVTLFIIYMVFLETGIWTAVALALLYLIMEGLAKSQRNAKVWLDRFEERLGERGKTTGQSIPRIAKDPKPPRPKKRTKPKKRF